jgi:hypothetical protein
MLGLRGKDAGRGRDNGGRKQTGGAGVRRNADVFEDPAKLSLCASSLLK